MPACMHTVWGLTRRTTAMAATGDYYKVMTARYDRIFMCIRTCTWYMYIAWPAPAEIVAAPTAIRTTLIIYLIV